MALMDDPPTRRYARVAIGFAIGLIVGLLAFLVRMMIDVDAIGATAIPFVLIGGIVGAAVGAMRNRTASGR